MARSLESYFGLAGKVAVITGAGGGLCGHMARALGGLGVRVAVLDLGAEKAAVTAEAVRAEGGEAEAYPCNVLEEEELRRVYQGICSRWQSPDFLVNGAGGNDPRGSTEVEFAERSSGSQRAASAAVKDFFALELSGFRATFELNFLGTVLPTMVFTRGMVDRGSGSVVNISSLNALTPLTKIPAYSGAKAAVANFTRWLAVHFAHTGVRVNALAPGFFMTEQLRFLHVDQSTGRLTPRAERVVAHTPMGRYGEPDDLVGAVIWLLSDSARFVTGALVPIDGGFSSYSL